MHKMRFTVKRIFALFSFGLSVLFDRLPAHTLLRRRWLGSWSLGVMRFTVKRILKQLP